MKIAMDRGESMCGDEHLEYAVAFQLAGGYGLEDARAQWEQAFLLELAKRCRGNVSEVARFCRVERATIHRLLKKHAISAKAFR